ncbi:phage tail tape measure protein [Klebsiella pneumoniae]|uniref:phage tail tape measure protein n=1 Tax=Klebsiella TaxID=570 RepID=UPI000EFB44B8|nr:phage tail tape measure protein [Klebsiella pneumoniae]AYO65930.1 phage tail tape measure protein [Klebsiella pneumoniae]
MANKKMNAVITIGGAVSGSLRGAFGTVKKSTVEIGSAITHLSREQRQLNEAMKRYGQNSVMVDRLRGRYDAIVGQVERLRKAQERLNAVERASAANLAKRAELRGQMLDTVALGAAVAAPIKIAADRESHAVGIAKQLQGARDEAGKLTPVFWQMRKAVTDLGHEIPLATNDLYDMAAAGLRMGVASNDILGFTRNTAKLAAALELDPGETAERFAKLGTVFKLSQDQLMGLGDAINYLDDQTTAKGGEIIDFMARVGGSAGLVKITAGQVAAIGTALISMGETAETAGTSTAALFSKLAMGDKNTKAAREAFKELGLSAGQMSKAVQKDAIGAMEMLFDRVRKLPEASRTGVLVDIFGQEHVGKIAKLVTGTKELASALEAVNGEAAKGSVQKEFQNTIGTTNAQMVLLSNRMADVADNIGTVLLPSVNDAASTIGRFTTVVANFAQEHPGVTKAVVGTAVALTSLKVATLAGGYAFTFLKGGALTLAKGLAGARAEMALTATGARLLGASAAVAQGGVIGLGRALVMNPIGAIAAGIAVAGLAIYKNWDMVKAAAIGFGRGMVEGLQPVSDAISTVRQALHPLEPAFVAVGDAVKGVFNWFSDLLTPTKHTADQLKSATDAGQTFGRVVGDAISFVLTPLTALVDGFKWISEHGGQIMNSVGATIDKAKSWLPSWAGGTDDEKEAPKAPAGLVAPPAPAMANRTGSTTVNTNDQYHISVKAEPGMNEDALARKVAETLKRQQAVRGRSMMTDGAYQP